MATSKFTKKGLRIGGAAAAVTAIAAAAALAVGGAASASPQVSGSSHYTFTTLDNASDLTFNQLLGINDAGVIAGYFGSGAMGHPNKGYLLRLPYGQSDYTNENFPGSAQTQVTGLNDVGNTVGFWANAAGANFGFYTSTNGDFHEVNFPKVPNSSPQMDQLLGINDRGVAVGFYQNKAGNARGYEYNIHTMKFTRVLIPGAPQGLNGPSLTVTGINSYDTVVGFYVNKKGVTVAFERPGSTFITFAYPGASMTQAFGINDSGEVVGAYTIGTGSSAQSYGFTWTRAHGFVTVNDPNGIGSTVINGVDDRGELVGFYTDKAGNTDGFLARPKV
jgi:hypothetical protein